MATKRPGQYTPLAANYADDDAIMEAGEDAELMYVRILAYCGRTPKTEGWVSDKQIRTRIGLETRPEIGPETAPETRAEKLADVGLLVREGDGYRVRSWLKWNRSLEEIARGRAQDRNRKGALTSDDTGNGTGKGDRSGAGNDTGVGEPETETETETETSSRPRKRGTKTNGSRIPEDFTVTDEMVAWAREHTPGVDGRWETEKFIDFWAAKSGAAATKVDWVRTWQNWMRTAYERGGGNVSPIRSKPANDPNAWMRRRPKGGDAG